MRIERIPCGDYDVRLKPLDTSVRGSGLDECRDTEIVSRIAVYGYRDVLHLLRAWEKCVGDAIDYNTVAGLRLRLLNLPTPGVDLWCGLAPTVGGSERRQESLISPTGDVKFGDVSAGRYILSVHGDRDGHIKALIPLEVPPFKTRQSNTAPIQVDVQPWLIPKQSVRND
jgi:hypothetical protein